MVEGKEWVLLHKINLLTVQQSTELTLLNKNISESVVKFLSSHTKVEGTSKQEAYDFQILLVLFSFLQLGGQRLEVIASFMVGVSVHMLCGWKVLFVNPSSKEFRRHTRQGDSLHFDGESTEEEFWPPTTAHDFRSVGQDMGWQVSHHTLWQIVRGQELLGHHQRNSNG